MPVVGEPEQRAGGSGTGREDGRDGPKEPEGTRREPEPEGNRRTGGTEDGLKEPEGTRREGGTKKPSLPGWALYGTPERVGDDVCQFWPETGGNRTEDRQGGGSGTGTGDRREPERRPSGSRTGTGGRVRTGPQTARAEGQEPGPEPGT